MLIFIAYTSSPWGLGAKIDQLVVNSEKTAGVNADTKLTSQANHDLLVRLLERCHLYSPLDDRAAKTAARPDKVSITE